MGMYYIFYLYKRVDDFYVKWNFRSNFQDWITSNNLLNLKSKILFQINISGVYHLESHDSGYADYLLAMDIPEAAVPHILAA